METMEAAARWCGVGVTGAQSGESTMSGPTEIHKTFKWIPFREIYFESQKLKQMC